MVDLKGPFDLKTWKSTGTSCQIEIFQIRKKFKLKPLNFS